jgi:DNA-directed RNA polymerase II subunit RPB1
MSIKRSLTQKEIEDICNVIQINKHIDFDVSISICENVKDTIRLQLKNIQIYPECIKELKKEIKKNYESSFIHPGEGVGCNAASSIGEQNTQASLNAFHSSGIGKANLNVGIPRLNELLNASKVMKTPSCTIYLNKEIIDTKDIHAVKYFCNKELIYKDIESVLKTVKLDYNPTLFNYEENYYKFFKKFYWDTSLNIDWRISLYLDTDELFKCKKTLFDIVCCIKLSIESSDNNLFIIFFPDYTGRIDIWIDSSNIEEPYNILKKKVIKNNISEEETAKSIINIYEEHKSFFFVEKVLLPLLYVIPISGIFGIDEVYLSEDSKQEWYIETKGTNLRDLLNHPDIDFKRTISNNVWDIFDIFGIDASKEFLENEFSKIINVNKRHLDLLISSMTTSGKIVSVSRYGIDRKQVGPLAKACFEQPFDNFITAALTGEKDKLLGSTANVCVGKQIKSGTGMVKLILNENILNKIPITIEENKTNIDIMY